MELHLLLVLTQSGEIRLQHSSFKLIIYYGSLSNCRRTLAHPECELPRLKRHWPERHGSCRLLNIGAHEIRRYIQYLITTSNRELTCTLYNDHIGAIFMNFDHSSTTMSRSRARHANSRKGTRLDLARGVDE